ncbi:MAG TPA: glycosyltransferase family 39 protein [Polyangia bacterium]
MTDQSTPSFPAPFDRHLRAWVNAICAAVAILCFGLFTAHAVDLAGYPWDWDPGEWGSIDAAHRLLEAPATLYPQNKVIPIPQTYGPTLAVLLMPIARLCNSPFLAARLLMLAIAFAVALAAYLLVRKRASRAVACLSSALILAPFNQSFWYVLVRVDAVMIALWLWSAVLALPPVLRRGADLLSWRRAGLAGALLALAALTKATAVVLAAALIAGWLLVSLRSAWRLAISTFVVAGLLVLLLQVLTRGGFVTTVLLQRFLPYQIGQIPTLLAEAFQFNWESLALFGIALGMCVRRRDGSWRDGAWVLWVAGPAMLLFLGKIGAVFNYLLPFFAGQAILLGRLLGGVDTPPAVATRARWIALRDLVLAATVASIALSHPFPSPDPQDRLTSQTFFRFVKTRGSPILAAQPECAYGEVKQAVEAEHTDFMAYLRAGLPGTGEVVGKVRTRSYHLLIGNQTDMRFEGAPYRKVGFCDLRFYYGLERVILFVPVDDLQGGDFAIAPGSRCRALPASPVVGSDLASPAH